MTPPIYVTFDRITQLLGIDKDEARRMIDKGTLAIAAYVKSKRNELRPLFSEPTNDPRAGLAAGDRHEEEESRAPE